MKHGDAVAGSLAPQLQREGKAWSVSLAQGSVVGIDAQTGTRLWTESGTTTFYCPAVPHAEDDADYLPIRCRTKGTFGTSGPDEQVRVSDLDLTVEGYNPRTGKATWNVPLGAAMSATGTPGAQAMAIDANSWLYPDARGGAMILDLSTGKPRKPADGERGWCRGEAEDWTFGAPWGDEDVTKRSRMNPFTPCQWKDGKVTPGEIPPAAAAGAVEAVIVAGGALAVWVDRSGVRAARVGY
jgi:hypothetical protein